MKIKTYIFTISIIICNVLTKEKLSVRARTESRLDIVGEAFNTDNKPVVAISYGVANTGKYTYPQGQSFMKPEMVVSIPDVIPPPKPGPLEAIDEIPSPTDYYNGDLKLNVMKVKCKTYANE